MPKHEIEKFIDTKEKWITDKLLIRKSKLEAVRNFNLILEKLICPTDHVTMKKHVFQKSEGKICEGVDKIAELYNNF